MKIEPSAELQVIDWGYLGYGRAYRRQKRMVKDRIADICPDRLVFVEHPPVVTLGRSGGLQDVCVDPAVFRRQQIGFYRVDRGGQATFHGPGQLVVYPILKIGDRDLHAFLKQLLDTVTGVLQSYALNPLVKARTPGVWVNGAKIASVGIAVRKWVTYHGAALNISIDPRRFNLIVPCGQPHEKMTTLNTETGRQIDLAEVKYRFIAAFCRVFGRAILPAPDPPAIHPIETRLDDPGLAAVRPNGHCPKPENCFAKGSDTFLRHDQRTTKWKTNDLSSRSAPAPICMEKMSPRPPAGP